MSAVIDSLAKHLQVRVNKAEAEVARLRAALDREREACAKVAEAYADEWRNAGGDAAHETAAAAIAERIRGAAHGKA